jgi:hypothetical protein
MDKQREEGGEGVQHCREKGSELKRIETKKTTEWENEEKETRKKLLLCRGVACVTIFFPDLRADKESKSFFLFFPSFSFHFSVSFFGRRCLISFGSFSSFAQKKSERYEEKHFLFAPVPFFMVCFLFSFFLPIRPLDGRWVSSPRSD